MGNTLGRCIQPKMTETVPREIGLGAKRVHLLGQRGPRNHFHGHGTDALRRKFVNQVCLVERVEITDVECGLLELGNFFPGGLTQSNDHIGPSKQSRPVSSYLGASFFVEGVGKASRAPHACFNDNLDVFGHEFLREIRIEGHAGFAGIRFFGYEYQHRLHFP